MVIDTNVHLGAWPFRHLPQQGTAARVAKLKAVGVTQAWVGSFDAVFQRDVSGANARLAEECRAIRDLELLPFGSVNPTLPDWEEDLRRAHETLKLAGLRLYPGYHGYKLDAPEFAALLTKAAQRGVPVQIAVKLEDERTQSPRMLISAVDLAPLVSLGPKIPGLRLQILNASAALADDLLVPLSRAGRVLFDIAMVEGLGGVGKFADRIGLERVAFGTHFPFFYAESSALKLKESEFTDEEREAIRGTNAERWRQP
jgi:predicted TIM-barrel fold metal-dependent hydrolase